MTLHTTRRGVLASIGLTATAGTALLTPQRRGGSPDLSRTVPERTWPVTGHDSARTKHAPEVTPPTTDARIAWEASVGVSPWNPALAVDDETVYVLEPDALTALDRTDGTERWRVKTGVDAVEVGPLTIGDRVLIATADGLFGVDAETGRIEWVHDIGGSPRDAVLVGEAIFLPDRTDDGIVAVDAETGAQWFRWSTDQFWSPVAFVDEYLVGYASGTVAAFDPQTGERFWRTETPGIDVSMSTTAVTSDGHVIVGSNPLVALDVEDGTEVWRWEVQTGEDEAETFHPATDGERVYVSAYWIGKTIAFDVQTGQRVWQVDESLGSPIVANGTVYCFDEDRITALGATDGRRLGQFGATLVPSDDVTETLAAAGDRLYAAFAPHDEFDAIGPSTVFALEAP